MRLRRRGKTREVVRSRPSIAVEDPEGILDRACLHEGMLYMRAW